MLPKCIDAHMYISSAYLTHGFMHTQNYFRTLQGMQHMQLPGLPSTCHLGGTTGREPNMQ